MFIGITLICNEWQVSQKNKNIDVLWNLELIGPYLELEYYLECLLTLCADKATEHMSLIDHSSLDYL